VRLSASRFSIVLHRIVHRLFQGVFSAVQYRHFSRLLQVRFGYLCIVLQSHRRSISYPIADRLNISPGDFEKLRFSGTAKVLKQLGPRFEACPPDYSRKVCSEVDRMFIVILPENWARD